MYRNIVFLEIILQILPFSLFVSLFVIDLKLCENACYLNYNQAN